MSDGNQQITEEFRADGGRPGGVLEGTPVVLVHHVGAKSGVERVSPLVHPVLRAHAGRLIRTGQDRPGRSTTTPEDA